MANDFLSGRRNGGSLSNGYRFTGTNSSSKGSKGNNTLEIQNNINDIKDDINNLYDNVSKLIAKYASEQNNLGNTNINQLQKQIDQLISGFSSDVQVDILTKAMAIIIANI